MDKLKYIKLENEDGSYSDSIPLAVDADYVDVNGSTLTDELNNKANNSSIVNLQNQISSLASGSPKPVSSISQMTDTTKSYVLTTDGYWYYYNGNEWTRGGVYQSTRIGEGEIVLSNLHNDLKSLLNIINPSYTTSDGYVKNTGVFTDSTNHYHTSSILLPSGMTIQAYLRDYSTIIAVVAETDLNQTYYNPLVNSLDSTAQIYEYTNNSENDIYITLSSEKNFMRDVSIYFKSDIIKKIITNINDITRYTINYSVIDNAFINKNGHIAQSNNWHYTSPILFKAGSFVRFKSTGYAQNVSMITECDENGDNRKSLVICTGNALDTYEYNVSKDTYLILCYYNFIQDLEYGYSFNSWANIINNLNTRIDNLNLKDILLMYDNITCVGDSLTYGAVYYEANHSRQSYNPYPKVLQRLTNAICENLGDSGATATTWWNNHNSQLINKTNQLTIIYLGTNGGLTDTMDTDVIGDDYIQYANTNTGNYAKIIKKSLTNESRVILVKCHTSTNASVLQTTNNIIEQMAERFNVPFVENKKLVEEIYHLFPDQTGTNSVHYNDYGYQMFTYQLIENIAKLSNNDKLKILPL